MQEGCLKADFAMLMDTQEFLDAQPRYMQPDAAGQARLGLVLRRIEALSL
ncbi:MAG: hypothetical protein ABI759_06670 [Candidatus Solibacter sp.]